MIRAALLAMLAASPAMAQTVEVIDGDTIRYQGENLRLVGIDAPEMDQPLGQWSREQLIKIIDGREIACAWDERGVYGRPLATCAPVLASGHVSSISINRLMVRAGAAYASPYSYAFERHQSQAMRSCIGVWSDVGLPWCHRREK